MKMGRMGVGSSTTRGHDGTCIARPRCMYARMHASGCLPSSNAHVLRPQADSVTVAITPSAGKNYMYMKSEKAAWAGLAHRGTRPSECRGPDEASLSTATLVPSQLLAAKR